MKYKEAMEYIESLKCYGIVPGLNNMRQLCRRLGNPQEALSFVHIAGTNGKGSVLAFLSSVLRHAGYRTGRYISPVIFEYRERIQIGERLITQAAVAEGLELIKKHCEEMVSEGLIHPTAYEVETALAFWYFHRMKCDIVVLETGMGGKEDATNIVEHTLAAVLTPVGMDHMQYLGKSLEEIAGHKAGIIKNNCYVTSSKQAPAVMQVLEQTAREKGCPLLKADGSQAKRIRYGTRRQRFDYGGMKDLEIHLAGRFQVENAVLAIETVKVLENAGYPVSEAALRKGLAGAYWPGRFMVVGKKPLFIADGAHNPNAAGKLAESIEFYFTNKRIIYIIGILQDKEYESMISLTGRYADQIITVTPPDNARAMHAYELAMEIARVHPAVTAVDSLEEAVEMSYLLAGKEDVIIAFGSLSYLGRLISIVEKRNRRPGKATGSGNGKS